MATKAVELGQLGKLLSVDSDSISIAGTISSNIGSLITTSNNTINNIVAVASLPDPADSDTLYIITGA